MASGGFYKRSKDVLKRLNDVYQRSLNEIENPPDSLLGYSTEGDTKKRIDRQFEDVGQRLEAVGNALKQIGMEEEGNFYLNQGKALAERVHQDALKKLEETGRPQIEMDSEEPQQEQALSETPVDKVDTQQPDRGEFDSIDARAIETVQPKTETPTATGQVSGQMSEVPPPQEEQGPKPITPQPPSLKKRRGAGTTKPKKATEAPSEGVPSQEADDVTSEPVKAETQQKPPTNEGMAEPITAAGPTPAETQGGEFDSVDAGAIETPAPEAAQETPQPVKEVPPTPPSEDEIAQTANQILDVANTGMEKTGKDRYNFRQDVAKILESVSPELRDAVESRLNLGQDYRTENGGKVESLDKRLWEAIVQREEAGKTKKPAPAKKPGIVPKPPSVLKKK